VEKTPRKKYSARKNQCRLLGIKSQMELKMKIKKYKDKLLELKKNKSSAEIKKTILSFVAGKILTRVLIVLIIALLSALGFSTELAESVANEITTIFI
jgi:hypothetical protein